MTQFELNAQLAKDTHQLLSCNDFYVLLHRNKTLPWFIVVPKYPATEWYHFNQEVQLKMANLMRKLSLFLEQSHSCQKINTATIGNVVNQFHLHVIGRYHDDPLWPDVVWGHELPIQKYSDDEVLQMAESLRQALRLL